MPDQEPTPGQTPEKLLPQSPEDGAKAAARTIANRFSQIGLQLSPMLGQTPDRINPQTYQRVQRGIQELVDTAKYLAELAASGRIEFEMDPDINKAVIKLPPRPTPPKQP